MVEMMRRATDSDTRQGTEHVADCPGGWGAHATAAAEAKANHCTLCTVRSHTDMYIIICSPKLDLQHDLTDDGSETEP